MITRSSRPGPTATVPPMNYMLIPALLAGAPLCSAALAFPGAEGAGAYTTGGRSGEIVHVTNLHADGPGSLAEAVSEGDRMVVFDVSGVIDLGGKKTNHGGRLEIDQPNITILGQTAPGEGICLKNGSLTIRAGNVIVRYLRVRRGWIADGDAGDAIEVKPNSIGAKSVPSGQSQETFDKIAKKKAERGKEKQAFADIDDVVIDHCSATWATDENMTVTHTGRATISYGLVAEGLDYPNPKQTPPNHSEGSLWGSSAPDGRSTMHHMLYACNRLRNPRTIGGADVPPVLTFYNNVVYNWSEYPTHTGSERVHVQWINNFYRPGPDTPAEARLTGFQFHGDLLSRVYPRGNVIDGNEAATRNNRLAVGWEEHKFKKVTEEERAEMIVEKPLDDLPAHIQSAADAYATVLAEVGATLPARDAVDLRIVRGVRDGTGRIIQKETDLAETWPDYRSLPPPLDSDHDGLPDFWEKQFGLNPADARDASGIGADGYANIEHYANNTDPAGHGATIVHVAATVSRATPSDPGEWRITRSGDLSQPLTVRYVVSGDAKAGDDYEPLTGSVVIAPGQASSTVALQTRQTAARTVVITLEGASSDYRVGCPSHSLVVIR